MQECEVDVSPLSDAVFSDPQIAIVGLGYAEAERR